MRCAALLLSAASVLAGCAAPPTGVASLRFIGEQRIAHRHVFQGTVVGGLSGIDYDPRSGVWILASDDRSAFGPARFYTARLDLDDAALRAVTLVAAVPFRQPDGSAYPSGADVRQPGEVADIEAVRFDPADGSIWYASEGSAAPVGNPFVREAGRDGQYRATLPLPAMFAFARGGHSGPRANLTVEGLAFADDARSLWLALEAPLIQDGPLATTAHGAVTRITRLDRTGAVLAQYAYPLDPVQATSAPGRLSDNGVSEILAVDARQLLVLERSGVQDSAGAFHFYCRLYAVTLDGATDVRDVAALANAKFTTLRKRLLLDLNAAGLPHIDNLEGMAWGPTLTSGDRTLVMVSDDNFSAGQVTQLLAFAVLPAK